MCEKKFGKRIEHEDIIARPNALTTHSLQIAKASDFSISKNVQFSTNTLSSTSLFFEGIFWSKTFKYGKMEIFTFFFANCLSTFSLCWLSIPSQIFKKKIGWFTSRCFYKHELCHLFCNMVLDLCLIIFLHSKKRHVENETINNASFEEHQGLFLNCS